MSYQSVDNAVRARLLEVSGVTNLVKNRIYPSDWRQKPTLPAVIIHIVNTQPFDTITGSANLMRSQVQLDTYALTKKEAYNLAEQCRLAIQGYVGEQLDVNILAIQFDTELEDYQPEIQEFRVINRYSVTYQRVNLI